MNSTDAELGLPMAPDGEWQYLGLHYCAASRTILVAVGRDGDFSRRFFVRRQDERIYRELHAPEHCYFYTDLAVATDAPFAFVMVVDRRESDPTPHALRLPDGQLTPLPQPTGYPTAARTWISQVLASSPDATQLQVVAGEHPPPGSDGSYSVTYSLARTNVATGHLEKIVDLLTPYA